MKESISHCLVQLREKMGLARSEVYTSLRIPQSTFCSYEDKRSITPPLDRLREITLFYGVEIDDFFAMVVRLEHKKAKLKGPKSLPTEVISQIISSVVASSPKYSADKYKIEISKITIESI